MARMPVADELPSSTRSLPQMNMDPEVVRIAGGVEQFMDGNYDDDAPPIIKTKYLNMLKIGILIIGWMGLTVALVWKKDSELRTRMFEVKPDEPRDYLVKTEVNGNLIGIELKGPFIIRDFDDRVDNKNLPFLTLRVQRDFINDNGEITHTVNASHIWQVGVVPMDEMDTTEMIVKKKTFKLYAFDKSVPSKLHLRMVTSEAVNKVLTLHVTVNGAPINMDYSVPFGASILIMWYIMIVWEVIDPTFATIFCCTLAIGILAAMNSRPSMRSIITWIEVDSLMLLFGMMIIVSVLTETGLFDYLAVFAFKITKGKVWPLLTVLIIFSVVLSSFLDNVTMVMLMTPVTIRLCEVLGLDAVPVLIMIVLNINVGGSLTPIGDPSNILIITNYMVNNEGVDFTVFVKHMLPLGLLVCTQMYFQLRFLFRNIKNMQSKDVTDGEVRRTIKSIRRVSLTTALAKDMGEQLTRKIKATAKEPVHPPTDEKFQETLADLQEKFPIRDKPLLCKSIIAMSTVFLLLVTNIFPEINGVSLGWSALLSAMLLLILLDLHDLESTLAHVDWSTLLFFSALFVLMESLTLMGLIECLGDITVDIITCVNPKYQLTVAILIILWMSAAASNCLDNVPVIAVMLQISIELHLDADLHLPLQPLVWALAAGGSLGGNGTVLGDTSNIVCASLAGKYGYPMSFIRFFKIGFPIMLCSMVTATCFLLIVHICLDI